MGLAFLSLEGIGVPLVIAALLIAYGAVFKTAVERETRLELATLTLAK
jgi:hypothetical protein